jgi:hypothetical protein
MIYYIGRKKARSDLCNLDNFAQTNILYLLYGTGCVRKPLETVNKWLGWWVMVLSAIFNNISGISWLSV